MDDVKGFLIGALLGVIIILILVLSGYLSLGNGVFLISLTGAFGAVGAAVAAWRSANATQRTAEATRDNVQATNRTAEATLKAVKETKKAILVEIIMRITEAYGSKEMLLSMIKLREWEKQYKCIFAVEFAKQRRDNYEAVKDIDEARRTCSHHFYRIYLMSKSQVVEESFVKKLVQSDQLDFLFEIIEPLEKAIDSKYNLPMFDYFWNLYDKVSS